MGEYVVVGRSFVTLSYQRSQRFHRNTRESQKERGGQEEESGQESDDVLPSRLWWPSTEMKWKKRKNVSRLFFLSIPLEWTTRRCGSIAFVNLSPSSCLFELTSTWLNIRRLSRGKPHRPAAAASFKILKNTCTVRLRCFFSPSFSYRLFMMSCQRVSFPLSLFLFPSPMSNGKKGTWR